MAYYDGQTLKQRLASGPLAVDEALEIATQIADGLAKAHAQGVVHRDVKPGNVMLTEDGVRIVDFGLATFADALKLTVEHSTLGTAAYMSPEQVRGMAADARSDVWAVGVILYEMLTGHAPFQGSHAEAIAYAVRNEAPLPIRASRPEVAEEIEHLVFRALHKEASVRFANGRELSRALRQVRGQSIPIDFRTEPVHVGVVTPAPRPPIKRTYRRKVLVAVAAALLAIGVATIWLTWPVERLSIAVAPFGNQTGDPDLEQYRLALTQTLTLSLSDARDLQVAPYARVLEILRRFVQQKADVSSRDAIQAVTAATGAELVVVPTLLRDGGAWRARVELRDPRTSNSVWEHDTSPEVSSLTRDVAYRSTMSLAEDIRAHLKSRRTSAIDVLQSMWPWTQEDRAGRWQSIDIAKAFAEGTAWYEDFEYAQAREAFRVASSLDPRNPLLLAWVSRAAQLVKAEDEAAETADRAVSLLTSRTPRADTLFVRAVAAEVRRDALAAETFYRALIRERPDDPTWAMELGAFLDRQTRNRDAVTVYHSVLSANSRLLRPQLELCRLYSPSRLNEPIEAKKYGETARSGYAAVGARAGEAQSLLCLTDTLAVGTNDERNLALQHAKTAREIFSELRYEYSAARAEYYLALMAATRGQFIESIAVGERALSLAEKAGNAPARAIILLNLGAAKVSVGNYPAGAEDYLQAYKLYQSWRDEARAAQIQANRGSMLIEHGGPEEGVRDVRNALAVFEKNGDRRFQTFCLRALATYYRNQGRLDDATRELNRGLAIARERNLSDNVTVMTTLLALTQFDAGDYESSRRSLVEALKGGTGRRSTEARIRLARTDIYLGDLQAADSELQLAEQELKLSPNEALRSLWWLVRGEWSRESRRPMDARGAFEKASALGTETLPEPPAVEARAYLGFTQLEEGRADAGRRSLESSIEVARKLGNRAIEARGHLLLAQSDVARGRLTEAADALDAIPADDAAQTIGPELRAEVHLVWARLHTARGDADAAARSMDAARVLIRAMQERLPATYRGTFSARQFVQRVGP
jgi:tetratricopeptide (TPR) repeat protein